MTALRHDWPQIIADIESAGVSIYKISMMLHRQYGTVAAWKRGSQPRHYDGELLLEIHAEYCGATSSSPVSAAESAPCPGLSSSSRP
jgi:hypothetical protein